MSVGVVASILVGVAFLFAGAAKVASGPGWRAQASALGAPEFSVGVVPWLEIVVGAALCAQVARFTFACAALVMLGAFSGLLIVRLSQGLHPPCACFGSWSAKPLSWRHLGRNAVLVALALVAAVDV